MNDASQSGTDPSRLQTCSTVFRQIRDAADETGEMRFRVVTERPVEGRSFDQLRMQRFRIGVGNDLTELPLLDMLFVYEMVQHDQRNKHIAEGHRRTVIGLDEIGEATARKLLSDIQQSPGIEVVG
jgi:hypothetical protein